MKQKPRIYYTETQKALMWERWKQGDSLQMIAQLFDRNHSSIQRILAESGGIRPAPRCRSRLALTLAEREEVSRAIVTGISIRALARRLGRASSTISRELRRNGGREAYRATQADQYAWDQARRSKPCKLTESRMLANMVASKLQLQWSPEQIAGWLKHLFTSHEEYHVSHETIYRSLYIQARGALRRSCWSTCAVRAPCGALVITPKRRTTTAELSMPCRSASVQRRRRIERCPGIGRGTCYAAATTARS